MRLAESITISKTACNFRVVWVFVCARLLLFSPLFFVLIVFGVFFFVIVVLLLFFRKVKIACNRTELIGWQSNVFHTKHCFALLLQFDHWVLDGCDWETLFNYKYNLICWIVVWTIAHVRQIENKFLNHLAQCIWGQKEINTTTKKNGQTTHILQLFGIY